MNKPLSKYFSLNRRYSRSINIERDLERLDALEGYIPTTRSIDALTRILAGFTGEGGNRAWTLTSVYGTGKSAFAQFMASLCAPEDSSLGASAFEIAKATLGVESMEYQSLKQHIPKRGFFRAVATAQREPVSHTIVRALARGVDIFWQQKTERPAIARTLTDLEAEIASGQRLKSQKIVALVLRVAEAAKTGVFLIIDELGKNLEFAAYHEGAEDLYLLQQLAELQKNSKYPIYLLGLLHQSFSEYAQRLAAVQRNEWAKIQGRFEDIPFADSAGQMMRLIGQAIDKSQAEIFQDEIARQATAWWENLSSAIAAENLSADIIAGVYPLHPIAALVLPTLCLRYAQNQRSLFTFLTSSEPFSFPNFLQEQRAIASPPRNAKKSAKKLNIESKLCLPTLKLHQVYDYFIESALMGVSSINRLQRWIEIQDLIADAKNLEPEAVKLLKTIGILNLVTTTGALRATRQLVTSAMCDRPNDSRQIIYWEKAIERLLKRGIVTHFQVLDELRIWEGSEFNVDSEIASRIEAEREPITHLLSDKYPLKPLVAQRHSYETGTLRYFQRCYLDSSVDLSQLKSDGNNVVFPTHKGKTPQGIDGLIGYWLDDELDITSIPAETIDKKPFILLRANKLGVLRARVLEFVALQKIKSNAPELQSDAVARREVEYRLGHARRLLDESLSQSFNASGDETFCWIEGKSEKIAHITEFNRKLSELCDRIYHKGLKVWNELINRRVLTAQAAKARRILIEAAIEYSDMEKLNLDGYGPEVSIYYSVFYETRIHRQENGEWGFFRPSLTSSTVGRVWEAMEDFCLDASQKLEPLDKLYRRLELPPYGVKQGIIPVLLAAVLLYRADDVGVYMDGNFLPVLRPEHFELLVKEPGKFALKYVEVAGLRSQVVQELQKLWVKGKEKKRSPLRNQTLLTAVKPLFQFAKKLPAYTKKTESLSAPALGVLKALEQGKEPDDLLFVALPQACGLAAIGESEAEEDGAIAKTLRNKLTETLQEIQNAYDCLLNECEKLLLEAFSVSSGEAKLREDLRERASYLNSVEPILQRFILVATDEAKADREWLAALLMVVADKPAESWQDRDRANFEINLKDIARRFQSLEAIEKEVQATSREGFEARLVTIARSDGEDIHQMVWMESDIEEQVEELVEKILSSPDWPQNPQLQRALVAKLSERVLNLRSESR